MYHSILIAEAYEEGESTSPIDYSKFYVPDNKINELGFLEKCKKP